MTKLLATAALATLALATTPAFAQTRATGALIVIVDTGRIFAECTACKAAQAQLKTQADAIQARQQALAGPLQTEGQAIQTAINALQGRQPDAALQARATKFQNDQTSAQRELQGREEGFTRNRAFVGQQISARLNPLISAAMKARGANMAIDPQQILAYEPALDVTNDVLAQLNAALPSVSVNAPAAAAPAAAPAGRPAAPGGR